jgi:hypothetical protein
VRESCLVHMSRRSALRCAADVVRGRCGAPDFVSHAFSGCRRVAVQRAQGALASATPVKVFENLCALIGAWVACVCGAAEESGGKWVAACRRWTRGAD